MAVEALMRLKDANGEYVSPVDFIPLAEETRLIFPLGEQLLQLKILKVATKYET